MDAAIFLLEGEMFKSVCGAVCVLAINSLQTAWAEQTAAEVTYLDLIYGHCFANIVGETITQSVLEPEKWEPVENFGVSEPEMTGAEDKVDLRFKSVGDAELMVDLKNQKICWTQITGVQAENMAARIRLSVIDGDYGGSVLEEHTETSASGQLSRLTTFAMLDWDEKVIPVIVVREMLKPRASALTVQVMTGEKNEK